MSIKKSIFASQFDLHMAKSKQKSTPKIIEAVQGIPVESVFHTTSYFKSYGLASLIIMILTIGIYWGGLGHGYILDDQMVITQNEFTQKGFGGIKDIFTKESFVGYFKEKKNLVQGNRYRPLSIATFAIERGVLGNDNPKVSHWINVLLYGLTGVVLMMILSMLFKSVGRKWYWSIPFIAGMLFVAHPIHTEVVANIKSRDEILALLFSLGALYSGLRYVDGSGTKWLMSAMGCFLLALFSKENAITFLAIVPLTIYFFSEGRGSYNRALTLSMLGIALFFVVVRQNIVGGGDTSKVATDIMNNPFLGMSLLERMGSTMYAMLKYIGLLLIPHPLSHDYYPYAIPKESIFNILPILSVLVYGGMAYYAWKNWRNKNVYAYAILFFLSAISIVSNVVVNVGTFLNERFAFMASIGFVIALAYFLVEQLPKWSNQGKTIGVALCSVLVTGYSWKTIDRVPDWRNAIELNRSAVEACPNSARANAFLATALFEDQKTTANNLDRLKAIDEVEKYATAAVKIMPDYSNANLMLIGVASERYKIEKDIKRYVLNIRTPILNRPDIPFIKEFHDYLVNNEDPAYLFPLYKEVGSTLLSYKDNRSQWAAQYLAWAHQINPNDAQVMEYMSKAYLVNGNKAEADRWAQAAINAR
jgi:protein O-mannosyl-transferase